MPTLMKMINCHSISSIKVFFSGDLLQDVQMAIFAITERMTFNDIQRYHGPVLKLVDIAENYIKSNIHWRVEFTGESGYISGKIGSTGLYRTSGMSGSEESENSQNQDLLFVFIGRNCNSRFHTFYPGSK